MKSYTPKQAIKSLNTFYNTEACYKKPWLEDVMVNIKSIIEEEYDNTNGARRFKRHKGLQELIHKIQHGYVKNAIKKSPRTTKTGKPSSVWSLDKRYKKYGPGPTREVIEAAMEYTLKNK